MTPAARAMPIAAETAAAADALIAWLMPDACRKRADATSEASTSPGAMRATVPMSGPRTPPSFRPQTAELVRFGTGLKVTREALSCARHWP